MIFIAQHYSHKPLKDKGIYTSSDLLKAWSVLCKPGCVQPFCFFSTSGVHGSYATLDDIEGTWGQEDGFGPMLTVVMYLPRLVSTWFGEVEVIREDIPALRKLCSQSIKNIVDSQFSNLPEEQKTGLARRKLRTGWLYCVCPNDERAMIHRRSW